MNRSALITGITGQDGSYLAEVLLEKGYDVHGLIRRTSTVTTTRIAHLIDENQHPNLHLHLGDLSDSAGLSRLIGQIKPDEVYNLAAQSHVKVSWDQTEYTADVTGVGVLRLLEAIRETQDLTGKKIKFYQASSSEMFGSAPPPQSLQTPFHPRSPYACAKVYGFWQTVNHRESYDMFAVNGILFNHECISENTPLMVRRNGTVDIVAARTLVPFRRKGTSVQNFDPQGLEVWDGQGWTAVNAITATKRRRNDSDHQILCVQTRGGVAEVTSHHHMIDGDDQICRADSVVAGDRMKMAAAMPASPGWTALTPEMAEFLGLMTAEGYVSAKGRTMQFTNNNPEMRERIAYLWKSLFLGETYEWLGTSGYNPAKGVVQVSLNGAKALHEWLREQLYTDDGFKRVSALVLNATPAMQAHYLRGYYAGDGLKAGKGDGVKTNSAVLAQGLVYLYANQGRDCSVYLEQRGERSYYQLNIFSDQTVGNKGAHLRKDAAEVRKVTQCAAPSEWVFDLETQSSVFCAGVGRMVVHNSPRRGDNFVTRKITLAVGRIKHGLQKELRLGNLDAKRDWGHARDYVEGMYQMLQHHTPRDYVVATGEAYSVREFAERAFALAELDWEKYVVVDPAFFRPAEVEYLLGEPKDTFDELNWKPKTSFEELVREMVEADMELARREKIIADMDGAHVLTVSESHPVEAAI